MTNNGSHGTTRVCQTKHIECHSWPHIHFQFRVECVFKMWQKYGGMEKSGSHDVPCVFHQDAKMLSCAHLVTKTMKQNIINSALSSGNLLENLISFTMFSVCFRRFRCEYNGCWGCYTFRIGVAAEDKRRENDTRIRILLVRTNVRLINRQRDWSF